MLVKIRTPLLKTLGVSLLFSAVTACNAAGGSMEGSPNSRPGKNTENVEATKPPTDYESTGQKPVAGSTTTLPPSAPVGSDVESEKVEIPSIVSGALLYCFKDKIEGAKATVLCAIENKKTNKPIKLADTYVSHKFSSAAPSALQVKVRELPIVALWHAEYTITASTSEQVKAGLTSVNFAFEGTDINDKKESYDTKVTSNMRLDLTIRSLKPQAAAEFRCMDLFRMIGDKIVTTPCGSLNSAQDWFITETGKISHVTGRCMRFNPVSGLAIEGDCTMNETPRYDISGEQIKIRDTNTCVGLIMPDASGVDYVGVVNCNTADITQHWKIAPAVLP
jgi:hypothetical protein